MSETRRPASIDRVSFVWLLAAVAGLALATSACNTMSGVGQDVEAAGGALSDTAEDVEEDLD